MKYHNIYYYNIYDYNKKIKLRGHIWRLHKYREFKRNPLFTQIIDL